MVEQKGRGNHFLFFGLLERKGRGGPRNGSDDGGIISIISQSSYDNEIHPDYVLFHSCASRFSRLQLRLILILCSCRLTYMRCPSIHLIIEKCLFTSAWVELHAFFGLGSLGKKNYVDYITMRKGMEAMMTGVEKVYTMYCFFVYSCLFVFSFLFFFSWFHLFQMGVFIMES